MRALSVAPRILAAAVLLLVLAAFTRPFVALYADERVGTATGLELVRGEPSVAGRYSHPELRGSVERRLRDAEAPALLALAAAVAALVLVLLPHRSGPALALVAALVGLAGLAWILVVTASPNVSVATDRRYALWLAGIGLVTAGVLCGLALAFSGGAGRAGRRLPGSRPPGRG